MTSITQITQWMLDEFKKAEGIDLSGDKMATAEIKGSSREGKEGAVITATTTNINLPFITANC